MISNTVRGLINLALSNLELENPTQEVINKATNYLKEAVLQIKEEKEQQTEEKKEYKVWLFNALYDTNYVQDEYPHLNGEFYPQKGCKRTDYIKIPEDVTELFVCMPLCGNIGYHAGNLYDKNKKVLYGISPSSNANTKYLFDKETITIKLEGNEKYLVLGSSSSGELASAYYISNEKQEKVFIHESDKSYTVNIIPNLKALDVKTGDTVTTQGYYFIGDGGEATYDIVEYEEFIESMPKDIQLQSINGVLTKLAVDEFGNHTLNNGLVAKLRLTGEIKPEQYGAKGDGVTNDCQAFTHMFAQIKTGKIIFKQNATYVIGMIYPEDAVTSFKDNPYKKYMCGNLLGGQFYGKPIMANIKDVEFVGNNAQITLQDKMFGNGGMGLLNFAGEIDGLKIHDLRFDGKGRTLFSSTRNKNSNHTLFYAPSTFNSTSTLLKEHHPLYDKITDSFSTGYFKNVEVTNCYFYDAGAMYKKAGDWGGDFILVINPTEMDNVNIHHNRFEAWGRWVFAVDLGGYGECMTNVKFNDNICIGANASVYDEESYQLIRDENNKTKYILPVPEYIHKLDPSSAQHSLEDYWRWRGLGFIDYEAKKCWKNMELQRNLIVGSAGWAINGNSRISEDFLIKDNIWIHQGGGYPYLIEFYSGFAKNWLIENNIIPTGGAKIGLTSENITVRNNKGNAGFRMFGIQGDIIFENNKILPNDGAHYHGILSLEGHRRPDYLPEDVPQKAKITFIGNELGLGGNLNYNQPYIDFDIHDNSFDNLDIANFNQKDLGYNDYSKWVNGGVTYNGFHLTGNNQTKHLYPLGTYCKKGETIIESIKEAGITVLQTTYHNTDILTPEQIKAIRWNNNNYQNLVGCTINGVKYNDFKMVCVEEGIIPQAAKYGFRLTMSDWRDFITTGNPLHNYAYVYYNRNLYLCTGTTEGVKVDQGKVDVDNPPTHTEGTKVCGTVYLQWIGKLGMAKLVGIE